MCARYPTPADVDRLLTQFEMGQLPDYRPQPNVAPTDAAPVVLAFDGQRALRCMRWGLLPHWATATKAATRMINARVESVFEKPAYSRYIKRSRCIIPAMGFFEWNHAKDPFLIRLRSGSLMGFAGIWNRWHDPVEPERVIETYSIITTDANSLVAQVHDRMPVIIPARYYDKWLSRKVQDPAEVAAMLCFVQADEVEVVAQDRALNSPKRKDVVLRV